jgi:23S rRNA pseudouridine2605 synthase
VSKVRLNKILAQAGVTSRRGGDRLILEGRVAVNGVVMRELGALADLASDRVTVDGRLVPPPEAKRYVVLHKPRGYVTTRHDPQGRPVVVDLVREPERLYPVGRLDADVEGLLILTNDGPLTHRLLHPRYGMPRVYEAEVDGHVRPGDLERWRAGVQLDDGVARPVAVALREPAAPTPATSTGGRVTTWLVLTFAEGRKHEVKRYCEALGHPVARLRRVAFGPIDLGDLRPGEWRELRAREVSALRAAVAK